MPTKHTNTMTIDTNFEINLLGKRGGCVEILAKVIRTKDYNT